MAIGFQVVAPDEAAIQGNPGSRRVPRATARTAIKPSIERTYKNPGDSLCLQQPASFIKAEQSFDQGVICLAERCLQKCAEPAWGVAYQKPNLPMPCSMCWFSCPRGPTT